MSAKTTGPDLAWQSAANFLRGLGINNQAELTMVLDIAMNPYSVYGKQTRKQPANPHVSPASCPCLPLLCAIKRMAAF